jgi:hypothetical protein
LREASFLFLCSPLQHLAPLLCSCSASKAVTLCEQSKAHKPESLRWRRPLVHCKMLVGYATQVPAMQSTHCTAAEVLVVAATNSNPAVEKVGELSAAQTPSPQTRTHFYSLRMQLSLHKPALTLTLFAYNFCWLQGS